MKPADRARLDAARVRWKANNPRLVEQCSHPYRLGSGYSRDGYTYHNEWTCQYCVADGEEVVEWRDGEMITLWESVPKRC